MVGVLDNAPQGLVDWRTPPWRHYGTTEEMVMEARQLPHRMRANRWKLRSPRATSAECGRSSNKLGFCLPLLTLSTLTPPIHHTTGITRRLHVLGLVYYRCRR